MRRSKFATRGHLLWKGSERLYSLFGTVKLICKSAGKRMGSLELVTNERRNSIDVLSRIYAMETN